MWDNNTNIYNTPPMEAQPVTEVAPKKSKKQLLIVLVVAASLIIGAAIAFVVIFDQKKQSETPVGTDELAVVGEITLSDNFVDALDQVYAAFMVVEVKDAANRYFSESYPQGLELDCGYNRVNSNGDYEWRVVSSENDLYILTIVESDSNPRIEIDGKMVKKIDYPTHDEDLE